MDRGFCSALASGSTRSTRSPGPARDSPTSSPPWRVPPVGRDRSPVGHLEVVGQPHQDPAVEPPGQTRRVALARGLDVEISIVTPRRCSQGFAAGDVGDGEERRRLDMPVRAASVPSEPNRIQRRRRQDLGLHVAGPGTDADSDAQVEACRPDCEVVAHGSSQSPPECAGHHPVGAVAQNDGNSRATEHAYLVAGTHATLHAPKRQTPQQVVAFRLHVRARRRLDVHAGDHGEARAGSPRAAFGHAGRRRRPVPIRVLVGRPPVVLRPDGGSGHGRRRTQTPLTGPFP